MLVLTRKKEEELYLFFGGVTVAIKVVEIKGQGVRLGIMAPRDVRVLRGELPEVQQMIAELGAVVVTETEPAAVTGDPPAAPEPPPPRAGTVRPGRASRRSSSP